MSSRLNVLSLSELRQSSSRAFEASSDSRSEIVMFFPRALCQELRGLLRWSIGHTGLPGQFHRDAIIFESTTALPNIAQNPGNRGLRHSRSVGRLAMTALGSAVLRQGVPAERLSSTLDRHSCICPCTDSPSRFSSVQRCRPKRPWLHVVQSHGASLLMTIIIARIGRPNA